MNATTTATLSTEQLSTQLEQRLATSQLTLPVLPAVASQVLTIVSDPESDAASLAQLIQNDQTLAGHVMKVANSPLMRGKTAMVSLQQAITRLGLRVVGEIALTAAMGPKLFKAPGYAHRIDELWQESLATAVWAKEISRSLRRNVEVAFLCGLLHQIGKPVILQAIQEIDGDQAATRPDRELFDLLDAHSRAAGMRVCAYWQLPSPVSETIEWLDDPQQAPTVANLVAMIAGARLFARHTMHTDEFNEEELRAAPVLGELNLYQDNIEDLLVQRDTVLATVQEMAL